MDLAGALLLETASCISLKAHYMDADCSCARAIHIDKQGALPLTEDKLAIGDWNGLAAAEEHSC